MSVTTGKERKTWIWKSKKENVGECGEYGEEMEGEAIQSQKLKSGKNMKVAQNALNSIKT